MLPNIQVAELLKRELTIGATLFRFAELSAWEAYPMLERIRHEIANTEASIRADQLGTDGTAEAAALFKMVMGARPQFVRELQADLFRTVTYRNASAQTLQPLSGSEEQAFQNLGISAIYRVLAQTIMINFHPFFQDLASLLGAPDPEATEQTA